MKTTMQLAALVFFAVAVLPVRADELSPEHRKAVDKGLAWVAKHQNPDGHWDANGGNYPVSMTALGGMALLMEGSTIRDGKYADNIRKATTWLMDRAQRSGMIGNPNNPIEAGRYMYGHGFSVLFLSQVYGEEEDADRREKLEKILTRAVEFIGKAQTARGGWGYVSARDGNGFDEGSVTITQVQALRAARNAGIVVPKQIIDKAQDYLKKCTTSRGGVIYSLANGGGARVGGERAPLTAAAVACMFSAGEYDSPLAKKWLEYCRGNIPLNLGGGARFGHQEYTHYYYAQALYILGDEGYARLFPESKPGDRLTWSKYRKGVFDNLVRSQNADGSWNGSIGTIYTTSLYLTILQLDRSTLPIYQR
ncbi:MAG: prenyltransferase/squalene oxidase repeat-containing protein [Gemmataceae bacterium]